MADNRYFLGWASTPFHRFFPRETEKAIMVSINLGYWGHGHEGSMWIPKSIMKVSNPNENGNVEILIPYWWVRKTGIERVRNIMEISMVGAVETEEEDGKIFILMKDGTKKRFGETIC